MKVWSTSGELISGFKRPRVVTSHTIPRRGRRLSDFEVFHAAEWLFFSELNFVFNHDSLPSQPWIAHQFDRFRNNFSRSSLVCIINSSPSSLSFTSRRSNFPNISHWKLKVNAREALKHLASINGRRVPRGEKAKNKLERFERYKKKKK